MLYGDCNPSAKLPYTIARASEDYSAQVVYQDSSAEPQIPYSEGLLIDYRWFDAVSSLPNLTSACSVLTPYFGRKTSRLGTNSVSGCRIRHLNIMGWRSRGLVRPWRTSLFGGMEV